MNEEKINIRQFKMLNSEEIIGLVNQTEELAYIIERPFKIMHNVLGGFSLIPWFPFSSQKLFKIAKEHIMHSVEIDEDMKTEYIKLAASVSSLPKPLIEPAEQKELLQEFDEFVEDLRSEIDLEDTDMYLKGKSTLH